MDLRNKIKQYGLKNSFSRFGKFLLSKVGIHYESFWVLLNKLNINEIESKMQAYNYAEVKELCLEDFMTGGPDVFNDRKLNLIKTRLQSGKYKCYGILDNNRLIYSAWISSDKIVFHNPSSIIIPINENQAILEDSYCHPAFRGKGIHSKMNLFRLRKISEMGFSEAVVIIVCGNVPALKTQIKSGFYKTKKIVIKKIFGRTYFKEKNLL